MTLSPIKARFRGMSSGVFFKRYILGLWCMAEGVIYDMFDEMKRASIPLYALESGDALDRFDVLAFSVGYEMAYTTVLDMLDMAGLPVRSSDRPDLLPLVFKL